MDKAVRNALVVISVLLLTALLSGCTDYELSTEEQSEMDNDIVSNIIKPDTIVQDSDASIYVNIKEDAFVPKTVTVKPNTEVIWTNWHLNSPDHTVSSNDDLFESGTLTVGDTFTYIFEEPGVYNYRCTYHSYMKGTVIVEE